MLLDPERIAALVERLTEAVGQEDADAAVQVASGLSPARIASVLREGSAEFILSVLHRMPPERVARTLWNFPHELLAELFEGDGTILVDVLAAAPPDQAADILQSIPETVRSALLAAMAAEQRNELLRLMPYGVETAGGVMTSRFVAIESRCTVGETIESLLSDAGATERTMYVYVQDAAGALVGVVSLKDLMRRDPAQGISNVMNPNVIAVRTDDSAAVAARLLRDRRFAALPVVDDAERLVGVITFEDAMDIMSRDVADSLISAGGFPDESFFTPPLGSVRRRLPWMAANVFLNLGAVLVITGFEATIEQVAILAAFLPMITDMGGNVGIQSLSVAIRSQALGESRPRDIFRAVRKEALVGAINGVVLGLLFAMIAFAWRGNPWLGVLAGIALGANVLIAGIIGGCLPFLIKALGKDPAMMTGPILTTVTDISGVSIYLGLSTAFLMRLVI